jgi:protein-S-isoprenylcysteine O-methyltransferase Ste14
MIDDALIWRRAAVGLSGVIYWAGVLVQARRIRRRIGRSPNLRPRGLRERLLWLGWFLVIAIWIGQPWITGSVTLGPVLTRWPALMHPASLIGGVALLLAGYAGTLWTYSAMGDSWRIGVDRNERTRLISFGPYAWVRHPIYAFQVVMLAGAVLLLPTLLSIAALVLHVVCVRIKARDEEQHLLTVHGQDYRDLCARTGGILPRLWGRGES